MSTTDPFWWEDAGPPRSPATEPLPAEVDVAIIGAGLTGLSAARTLAKRGKSVLVLDAQAPGMGASSRNGGMVGGGHRMSLPLMEARFGKDIATGLLREAHIESSVFVKTLMHEEAIECDYSETGRFRAFWRPEEYEAEAVAMEQLQHLIGVEAEMISPARQREEVGSDLYAGGIVFPRHGGLNPAKWVAGILVAAQRAGAIVHGDTPVLGLAKEGATHVLDTPRGAVRAGQVLAATNGYTPELLKHLRRRIIPVPSFIVATESLGANRVQSLFPKGRMIVESRVRHCYYRPSPDGQRIVFGGRAAMYETSNDFAERELAGLLHQIFPQLGDVDLTHSWRGRTGFSFDSLPNVGQLNGIWHAMGYSGSGNAMAPWLGHKAALQMLGDPEGRSAFSQTGFPQRWWHRGRPWFLPFADVVFRMRDGRENFGKARH